MPTVLYNVEEILGGEAALLTNTKKGRDGNRKTNLTYSSSDRLNGYNKCMSARPWIKLR